VNTSPALQLVLELAAAGFRLSDSALSSSSVTASQILLDFKRREKRRRDLDYIHHFTSILEADGFSSLIGDVLGRVFAPSRLKNDIVFWDLRRQSAGSIPRSDKLLVNELTAPDIKHENEFPLLHFTFDAEQDLLVLFEDFNQR
jgi:hypothetical protein